MIENQSKIKIMINKIGLPRLIISLFFLMILITAGIYKMSIPDLLTDIINRWGMNLILVLAMVPGVQSGIGLNFGISLGIVGGLLGSLISIEINFASMAIFANNKGLAMLFSLIFAIVLGILFSAIIGFLYGLLLNRVKGSEMTVSIYVGFSIIAFMNIMWLVLPFKNGEIIWVIGGEGLRNTISLNSSFEKILNNFLQFKIFGITFPTGLFLFIGLCCLILYLFFKSKSGIAMSAAGSNPKFAQAAGIDVNKMRIIGTIISTVLGSVGIIIYSQSYGYLQLYNAPLSMGVASVAAILIGGASIRKASITNVWIGTFLFQGILSIALPVANKIMPKGNVSEIIRIIISNGIILYALTKIGGDEKNE